MEQGYLEQEANRVNKTMRKTVLGALAAMICIMALLYFLMRNSFDLSDPSNRELVVYGGLIIGVIMLAGIIRLLKSGRSPKNGGYLSLPFEENTKEAVGKIIDQEVAAGKLLVENYIYEFKDGKKPYGEKIALTPSYLLILNGGTKVTAIPREKIYWTCAQVGHKGDSFRVQLLVFTEKKIFKVVGVDIEHVQQIANQLYQYIPNVFRDYDPSSLSYELEQLFRKNREEFLRFYEEKRKTVTGI